MNMITAAAGRGPQGAANAGNPAREKQSIGLGWHLSAVVILIVITSYLLLLGAPQDGSFNYQQQDESLRRGNLAGLTLNGFVRDPLLFVAANYLLDPLNYLTRLTIIEQAQRTNCSQVEQLPPVSGSWLKTDKLKRLIKSDHQTVHQIPDYPLDQQPDPERVTHIDADLRSCLGAPRAQLNCGACYAFSWNALLEWHYCKQTGSLLDVSEQHIIDCSKYGGFSGCQSGKIEDVKTFAQTFGFYLEQEYPYRAKYREQLLERCKNTHAGRRFRAFEWKRLIVDGREWEQVLEEQPILVQAHLPSDIMNYKQGIHPANNCNPALLHGMLLVGHGREQGKPYWLVRNSMGEKWGEGGHFRLARDDSTMSQCFATGWIGKFKFDSIDADKYEEFYSQIEFEPTEHILKRKNNSAAAR